MNKIVYMESVPYIVKSETNSFYVIHKCEEEIIVSIKAEKTKIIKIKVTDEKKKVKKEKLKEDTEIEYKLDIDKDYLIYSPDDIYYNYYPIELEPTSDKFKLIIDLLKDSRYERIFEFWNIVTKYKNINKIIKQEDKDKFKEYLNEFNPYSSDIFKITNFKL